MAERRLPLARPLPGPSFPDLSLLGLSLLGLPVLLALLLALPQALSLLGRAGQGDALAGLLFWQAALPRLAMALLAGAVLGLAGAVFQQVLRNPLAEPGTLGLFAGARFALVGATLWAPGLLAFGPWPVALGGGAMAVGLVLLLARRQGFAPLAVILAGLVVTLALEAANKALLLVQFEALLELSATQAGLLAQNGWRGVARLGLPVLALLPLVALLPRPLALLELGAEGARSAGLSPARLRLVGLLLAMLLAGLVTAELGALGGIGLIAPALARMAGARRPGQRLSWSALAGAGLLALTDQGLLALLGPSAPAGSLATLLGTPLLLWLVARQRAAGAAPQPAAPAE
ncbi:iron chelate uptake ABC transporter family permease subunit, partial [Roseomonas sp. GC11]|uniref:iron chelate uptake ABC transporter family permease subunit n=1 Tax=Roseomonas sp. GC11 TaxID=2950546 RepID=UPI00210A5F01